ncbi:elongator complex protein 5 [Homalodisca vitripennis]|uniref:elongator complex protein 5 n=1 Tax=Homalodisca vitripennis TaxID=197043 RepID=UPI001EEB1806|nr:elongator complex protein 5 [Homalodisca vitripennis]
MSCPEVKKTLKMFELLATTNLIVFHDKSKSIVTTSHRKASGRIIQTIEEFSTDSATGLISTKEIELSKASKIRNENDNIANIDNDVTFKLGLEDEEKRARSELVLPYLKTAKPGSGEIVYEPDANDDWDEEDPDDDLNI